LTEGIQLLRGRDPEYNPLLHGEHTLSRIRSALAGEEARGAYQLLQSFADMLTFDAWIGNSDRHQENWGIVVGPNAVRLAPIYDTAACLGAELQSGNRLLAPGRSSTHLDAYLANCGSGFGRGGPDTLPMSEVVAEAAQQWPEWRTNTGLLQKFEQLLGEPLSEYLATIPEDWLSVARKDFMCRVLERRLIWLGTR
jgi:hypothetical protein